MFITRKMLISLGACTGGRNAFKAAFKGINEVEVTPENIEKFITAAGRYEGVSFINWLIVQLHVEPEDEQGLSAVTELVVCRKLDMENAELPVLWDKVRMIDKLIWRIEESYEDIVDAGDKRVQNAYSASVVAASKRIKSLDMSASDELSRMHAAIQTLSRERYEAMTKVRNEAWAATRGSEYTKQLQSQRTALDVEIETIKERIHRQCMVEYYQFVSDTINRLLAIKFAPAA